MRTYYMLNGEPVSPERLQINALDRGFLYGYSLFETMLVREGKPVFLQAHVERLLLSAADLGIVLPVTGDGLAAICRDALRCSGVGSGVLRLTATAGPDNGNAGSVVLAVREGVPYRPQQYEKGIAVLELDFPRNEKSPLVRHKTANYLENLLGRRKARSMGCDEGIFLNTRGRVAEGTASNIFIVINGEIWTPPVEAGLLPGIIRRLVIDYSSQTGLCCQEKNITRDELACAGECFVTNSLMGVMPVTELNGLPVGTGVPGPVTLKVADLYNKLIKAT
ncbi:aminotransferase class IV [Desulfoscipio geothermicus]|uniref:Branched-chain amino acid aminotransferase n=1 Tax=Desulfoscipio geothermicus DSM 3669 TaxID=1121426 RepID=A0A1I6E6W3_9FIRM|nr:aminotransferase class IV [Desulfoscipio geothermicus]SFR13281.1 branched-chain amino acid aminotransferase [Desulfoscipio geothermicus DSM 3669]